MLDDAFRVFYNDSIASYFEKNTISPLYFKRETPLIKEHIKPDWFPLVFLKAPHNRYLFLSNKNSKRLAIWTFSSENILVQRQQKKALSNILDHTWFVGWILKSLSQGNSILESWIREILDTFLDFEPKTDLLEGSINIVDSESCKEIDIVDGTAIKFFVSNSNFFSNLICGDKNGLEFVGNSLLIDDFTIVNFVIHNGSGYLVFSYGHVCQPSLIISLATLKFYLLDKSTRMPHGPNGKIKINEIIYKLSRHLATYKDLLASYLSDTPNGKPTLLLRSKHIGHSLWNELSALEHLFKNNTEFRIAPLSGTELYDKVENLFEGSIVQRFNSLGELISDCYKNNSPPIRYNESRIPSTLVDRIVSRTLDENTDAERAHISIAVGMRCENRYPINYIDFIVLLAEKLVEKTNLNIHLLIDGHNVDGDKSIRSINQGTIDIEEREIEFFNKLTLKVNASPQSSRIVLVKNIGFSITVALKKLSECSFFVAPWGAGLVKYKWLLNQKGIVLTNSWNLVKRWDLGIYDFDKYRENQIPSHYLPSEYVEDDFNYYPPIHHGGDPSKVCFNIDLFKAVEFTTGVLYKTLLPLKGKD